MVTVSGTGLYILLSLLSLQYQYVFINCRIKSETIYKHNVNYSTALS